ncbi:MAG: sodium-translocating pyrophosphatase [Defluviitaleaceae bacterium]|nr:sodium-translocating pyrophosphatase [Defluviitaleaceae bacterium]
MGLELSLILMVLFVGALSLVFAFLQGRRLMTFDEGNSKMKEISQAIRTGANAFFKRQYTGAGIFFGIMFLLMGVLAILGLLNPFAPFAFITGGLFSGLSGFIGMRIATHANSRTAQASSKSLNSGLRVAFTSGSVMGFTVAGVVVFDIAVWYLLLRFVFFAHMADGTPAGDAEMISAITSAMLTFGMGSSTQALFARVGGGIFTKAADVGADLVGKVEAGIPEDDPRNPAVIADNVGDNVGDIGGLGADLFESLVATILASMALGVAAGHGFNGVVLPLVIAAAGIVASFIGTFFVQVKEDASQKALLSALRRGVNVAAVLVLIAALPIILLVLGKESLGVYFAVVSGLAAGVAVGFTTEYYTSDTYKPTKDLADSATSGSGPLIINGLALGMLSAVAPVLIIGVSVIVSFILSGGMSNFESGIYGVAISGVGMLATIAITLTTDAYGPVADNAGGIAEMAGLPEEVRKRTDALDSLGNTTAATGKGFAIGSASLAALAMIVAYADEISQRLDLENGVTELMEHFSIMNPPVLIGLFIGAAMTFLFSAMTMQAVGKAAQNIVVEVRRQFREIKGIMDGTGKPDYAACVDLCTRGAQKSLIPSAIVAIGVPIACGLLLGYQGVVGMLAGGMSAGLVLALMMANAGGAWDNAKKYIEAGNHGGKGSEAHKAAVVGDTVGDPLKDTSGPSVDILIKLMSMVSIVFVGLVLKFNLWEWVVGLF